MCLAFTRHWRDGLLKLVVMTVRLREARLRWRQKCLLNWEEVWVEQVEADSGDHQGWVYRNGDPPNHFFVGTNVQVAQDTDTNQQPGDCTGKMCYVTDSIEGITNVPVDWESEIWKYIQGILGRYVAGCENFTSATKDQEHEQLDDRIFHLFPVHYDRRDLEIKKRSWMCHSLLFWILHVQLLKRRHPLKKFGNSKYDLKTEKYITAGSRQKNSRTCDRCAHGSGQNTR